MFLRESIWNIWNISCLRAYQNYFDVWGLKARSLGSEGLLLPPLLLNACVHIPVDASAYACDRVMENLYTTCSCVAKTLRVKNTTMFAKESTGHRRHLYRLPSLTVESLTTGFRSFVSQSLQIQSKLTFTQTVRAISSTYGVVVPLFTQTRHINEGSNHSQSYAVVVRFTLRLSGS